MSRWRLLTGTSTGSQTVPPEWCSHGVAYVSFTNRSKSASDAYRRPSASERTNGDPYAGAITTASPPIETERAGLRACWVNTVGAVEHSARTCPGSNRTRSPSTLAPAAPNSRSASGSPRMSIPTSASNWSAFVSMRARPSSVTSS